MITPELLEQSELQICEDRFPSRIILRKVKERTFATHIEVHPPEGKAYLILGRYFFNLAEAQKDFQERILELQGVKQQ